MVTSATVLSWLRGFLDAFSIYQFFVSLGAAGVAAWLATYQPFAYVIFLSGLAAAAFTSATWYYISGQVLRSSIQGKLNFTSFLLHPISAIQNERRNYRIHFKIKNTSDFPI